MELTAEIKSLISHGDAVKIAAENPDVSYNTIRAALQTHQCSDKVFAIVKKFYDEKAARFNVETPNHAG
jgi:hypothetical protein